MFSRLFGHKFEKLLKKARHVYDLQGDRAAVAVLGGRLVEPPDESDPVEMASYTECWILQAHCQAGCAIEDQNLEAAVESIRVLYDLLGPTLPLGPVVADEQRERLLAEIALVTGTLLGVSWIREAEKSRLVPVVLIVAETLLKAGKFADTRNLCERALVLSPGNLPLTLTLAEACLGLNDRATCLGLLKGLLDSGGEVKLSEKLILFLATESGSDNSSVAASANSLLGRLHIRQGTHEAALPRLEAAAEILGDQLEETDKEGLLRACARTGKLDAFEEHGQHLLRGVLSPALFQVLQTETSDLLAQHPQRASLRVLWGACCLREGRWLQAVKELDQAMQDDPSVTLHALNWYVHFKAGDSKNPGLLLGLAAAAFAAKQYDPCLKHLAAAESLELSAEQLARACAVGGDLLKQMPQSLEAMLCLARLLARENRWPEVLAVVEQMLPLEGAADRVAKWCERARQQAARLKDDSWLINAWKIEIRACLRSAEFDRALDGLHRLSHLEIAAEPDWQWTAACLESLVAKGTNHPMAELLLGEVLGLLNRHPEAAAHYLHVVTTSTSQEVLAPACAALTRNWQQAQNPDDAALALAKGFIQLDQPQPAHDFILHSFHRKHKDAHSLLDILKRKAAEHPSQIEWRILLVEAEVACGEESVLADALAELGRLLETHEGKEDWVAAQAQQIEEQSQSVGTKGAALLLRIDILARTEDWSELCETALVVAREFPALRARAVTPIQNAAIKAPREIQARIFLALGQMFKGGNKADTKRAAGFFAQAAAADPTRTGDLVTAESRQLALAPEGCPDAIVTALRTGAQLPKAAPLWPDLLRVMPALEESQIPEVRRLAADAVKDAKAPPEALLALARCEVKLKNVPDALASYQRLMKLSSQPLTSELAGDLQQLHEQAPGSTAIFWAWISFLESRENFAKARAVILHRLRSPAPDAEDCLQRLAKYADRKAHNADDLFDWAQGCELAGLIEDAVAVWRSILATPDLDHQRCLTALTSFQAAHPKNPSVGALLARAQIDALPPDELLAPLQLIERVLALPDAPAWLPAELLELCGWAVARAGGDDAVARQAAFNQARIFAGQDRLEDAIARLEELVHQWPSESSKVAALCRLELEERRAPLFNLPLARACLVQGDLASATAALQALLAESEECRLAAERLSAEFAQFLSGPERAAVELLRADALVRLKKFNDAGQLYLEVAHKSPECASVIKQHLQQLIDQGVESPEIHLALCEVEFGGQPDNLPLALRVLERFLAREPERNFDLCVERLGRFRQDYPARLEARLGLVACCCQKGPDAFPLLEREAMGILDDFGKDGARAVIEALQNKTNGDASHIPLWWIKCAAHERLGEWQDCLACLQNLREIDLAGQAAEIKRRATDYLKPQAPEPAVVTFLADLARDLGDYAESARRYAEAVELPQADLGRLQTGLEFLHSKDQREPVALGALARCAWLSRQPDSAAGYYRLAGAQNELPGLGGRLQGLCEAFPDSAMCWFVRGECCFQQKDFSAALPCLERALELPALEAAQQVLACKLIASIHVSEARFEAATASLRRALAIDSSDNEAAHSLIDLYFERHAHRIHQIQALLGRNGDDLNLMLELARLHVARGEHADALASLQKIPRQSPVGNAALMEAGRCHLALNQCNWAIASFKAVLANHPSPAERQESLHCLALAHGRLLEFDQSLAILRELCAENPFFKDAGELLQAHYEQAQRGDALRLADVPFNFLSTWREKMSQADSMKPGAEVVHATGQSTPRK